MKKSMYIAVLEKHLMEKVSGALVMALLEILQYLRLIIVHHLILTKKIFLKKDFLIVGEGDTFLINGSFGAPEKSWY